MKDESRRGACSHAPDGEQQAVDWHSMERECRPAVAVVDSRVRLRACLVVFLVLAVVVLGRVVQLEWTQGAEFRRLAGEPLVRHEIVPVARGRIVTGDGVVLAQDVRVRSLAVRYRWLQDPADAAWLRATARSRLPRAARRDTAKVAAEEQRIREEVGREAARLAELCGLGPADWRRRAAAVQARVERIARSVNRRERERFEKRRRQWLAEASFLDRWLGPEEDEGAPERIVVREELDYHVVVEDVAGPVVAEIKGHSERYAGARIVEHSRREYPAGSLAAHVVGYMGLVRDDELRASNKKGTGTSQPTSSATNGPLGSEPVPFLFNPYEPGDRVGREGLERSYERELRGERGERIGRRRRDGRVLASEWVRQPRAGCDLVLTLDARLQETAEQLLDDALARRELTGTLPERAGGAAIVMDARSGAIRAMASAPRFAPAALAGQDASAARAILNDAGEPLFHRAIQMAVAPGSVFKVVTAVALVESCRVDPRESFYCRGYLEGPGAWQCQIYRQQEQGHGEVAMADALAVSCNVYFFHHVGAGGGGARPDARDALVEWARRLGFGAATGIDLPGEAAGRLPTPETIRQLEGHGWRVGDTRRLAIGQGSLTATPLQVARMMAVVANGGYLVTPHVVDGIKGSGVFVSGQDWAASGCLRRNKDSRPLYSGLRMAVESPRGTAYATVRTEGVAAAGKTGTAQTGEGRSDHAWFAGYVPADDPRYVVVVALEHSGEGGEAAGPVAKRLIVRMRELEWLE